MATCFLSYSYESREVAEPVRRLLETLGFDVDAPNGPDDQRVPGMAINSVIGKADCVVILYGPDRPPQTTSGPFQPAKNPRDEAMIALGQNKPMALLVHTGTEVPKTLQEYQPFVSLNFWNAQDVVENISNVVKHLLELKRRVDLPPGTLPYAYRKASSKLTVEPGQPLVLEVYHEVVARQPCSVFHHQFDTGGDLTASFGEPTKDNCKIRVTYNAESHQATLRLGKCTSREIEYFVDISPPLRAGEDLGYWRRFTVNNYFPLSRSEIEVRSQQDGYPKLYKKFGGFYYGDMWDVFNDMERINLSFHFPDSLKLSNYRTVVVEYLSRAENKAETERCNTKEYCKLRHDRDSGTQILELAVTRPLINHSYILLYEPEE